MLEEKLAYFRLKGYFPTFPFGSELEDEEIALDKSLRDFKQKATDNKLTVIPGFIKKPNNFCPG